MTPEVRVFYLVISFKYEDVIFTRVNILIINILTHFQINFMSFGFSS